MISGGESLKLATRVSELRKSRPGTPRLDSRVGSQVTFALNSDGGNLNPSVPGTPRPVSINAETKESAVGGDVRTVIEKEDFARSKEKASGSRGNPVADVGPEDEENRVQIENEEGKVEVVGYGYASLHDERENDRNDAHRHEVATLEEHLEGIGSGTGNATKQIKFAQ